ncbi:GTP-binding protein [Paenibacillus tarimensis]
MDVPKKPIPVHLLSGFLGGGKTTLLKRLLEYYGSQEIKAAIIMNEIGDVNLDGQLVDGQVPMSEMLSGCICCTIRGDLSMEIKALIDEHQPEVILIESTGAANPLEIIDGVTEAALLVHIDLQSVTTVVDGPGLLEMSRKGRDRTFKLMQEQIRCATHLVCNKADRLASEEIVEVEQLVREWNASAPMIVTVQCVIPLERFGLSAPELQKDVFKSKPADSGERSCGSGLCCGHDHHEHDEHGDHMEGERPQGQLHVHESHDHVMVVTHYLNKPVDSHAFEALLKRLPSEVYRAKGIVTFTDTPSRFLFQFAYREVEFIRITPQAIVNDVAVFIGEHFSKSWLLDELRKLES